MGRILLAVIAVGGLGWMVGAALLMNLVGIVHSWWPFVPTMPYSVALKICAVYVIASLISGLIKGLAGDDS